jgi:DNA-binding transcriptional LysR family regulator
MLRERCHYIIFQLKDVRGHVFAPVIVEYLERYSETGISALFLDRNVNLLQEGIDVGLRIGAPGACLPASAGTLRFGHGA